MFYVMFCIAVILVLNVTVMLLGDDIRLVNGMESANIGVLQYKLDGRWGAVCKESWNNMSADVACKQLGYPYVCSVQQLPSVHKHKFSY